MKVFLFQLIVFYSAQATLQESFTVELKKLKAQKWMLLQKEGKKSPAIASMDQKLMILAELLAYVDLWHIYREEQKRALVDLGNLSKRYRVYLGELNKVLEIGEELKRRPRAHYWQKGRVAFWAREGRPIHVLVKKILSPQKLRVAYWSYSGQRYTRDVSVNELHPPHVGPFAEIELGNRIMMSVAETKPLSYDQAKKHYLSQQQFYEVIIQGIHRKKSERMKKLINLQQKLTRQYEILVAIETGQNDSIMDPQFQYSTPTIARIKMESPRNAKQKKLPIDGRFWKTYKDSWMQRIRQLHGKTLEKTKNKLTRNQCQSLNQPTRKNWSYSQIYADYLQLSLCQENSQYCAGEIKWKQEGPVDFRRGRFQDIVKKAHYCTQMNTEGQRPLSLQSPEKWERIYENFQLVSQQENFQLGLLNIFVDGGIWAWWMHSNLWSPKEIAVMLAQSEDVESFQKQILGHRCRPLSSIKANLVAPLSFKDLLQGGKKIVKSPLVTSQSGFLAIIKKAKWEAEHCQISFTHPMEYEDFYESFRLALP